MHLTEDACMHRVVALRSWKSNGEEANQRLPLRFVTNQNQGRLKKEIKNTSMPRIEPMNGRLRGHILDKSSQWEQCGCQGEGRLTSRKDN